MDQYQDHVARIMEYLTERKQCASSRFSHQKCYEEFGAFLEESGLMFTVAAREEWLAGIKSTYSRQQCYFWRNYLQQLQAFMETGTIPDGLFYQIHSFSAPYICCDADEPMDGRGHSAGSHDAVSEQIPWPCQCQRHLLLLPPGRIRIPYHPRKGYCFAACDS